MSNDDQRGGVLAASGFLALAPEWLRRRIMPKRNGRDAPGPSVKDPEMYEDLRDKGMSKEKAARISNAKAAGENPSKKGGKAPPYEEWTKADLYDQAQKIGIDGRSKMNKKQLIAALRNH
jgi:hypothetical protein